MKLDDALGDGYAKDVHRLLKTNSPDDYNTVLEEMMPHWSTQFKNYYDTYNAVDVLENNIGALQNFGLRNVQEGLTNNPAESMNAAMKTVITHKSFNFWKGTIAWYTYQNYILAEIIRGMNSEGEFKKNT